MIRIGLTQRVSLIEEYGERRDCLDQQWTTLLETLGYSPVPLPNQVRSVDAYVDGQELDGFVLTSGNDLTSVKNPRDPAPERDATEKAILEYANDNGIPVLGVCRGLELLNTYFGGDLAEVTEHVDCTHPVEFTETSTDISLPEQITVNSYHEYGITPGEVGENLSVLGTAPDGTVECVMHESRPFCGIMWHPERESPSSEVDRRIINHVLGGDS